jgi:outer membrane protein OmpA-like peptidoglycan-associated protein
MRTRLLVALSAVTLATAIPSVARAQAQEGFAVNRFEPSERGSDFHTQESLDLRGRSRFSAGLVGEWNYKSFVLFRPDGSIASSVARHQVNLHLGIGWIFLDRFRLALSLPLQAYGEGAAGTDQRRNFWPAPKDSFMLGDARLALDARLAGEYGGPATVAVGVQAWLPTGSKDSYTSDGDIRLMPRAMIAGNLFGGVVYAARLGYMVRGRKIQVEETLLENELTYGFAVGMKTDSVILGPELNGSTNPNEAFKRANTFTELLIGSKFIVEKDWRIGVAAGAGLSRVPTSPDARVVFGVEWFPAIAEPPPPDRDRDGIFDKDDACPDVPGVKTDDPKTNGCPVKPGDADGDGIIDAEDACVDVPGVKNDDPKKNGCPPDKDGDGIWDKDDACVDVPGVKSDDPKKNGCPPDTDGDGIIDTEDACPKEPGIKTNDPKTNGCPDTDRDKDGIPNDVDACPDEPGEKNDDPKKNGCPKAFVQGGEIKITDQVKFKTNSAEILPGKDSEEVLTAVAKVLKDKPEIKKVRVEGHTDNQGPAAYNKTLSANRAASVVKWLTKNGVEASRLTSAGFGQDKPIDSNTTEAGRKNNRRVEFHIDKDAGDAKAPDKPADPKKPDAKPPEKK